MKLTAHLVWRQGVRLCLDDIEVGYFACSGVDAMMLLCTIQLALKQKIDGIELRGSELADLREWIGDGQTVPDS